MLLVWREAFELGERFRGSVTTPTKFMDIGAFGFQQTTPVSFEHSPLVASLS